MATAPQTEALKATGGMVAGEQPPFGGDDPHVPDHGDDIMEAFGLSEDMGSTSNSGDSSSDGGASPSPAASAAEGSEGQTTPTTPSTPQTQPGEEGDRTQAPAQAPAQQPTPPAAPAPQQPAVDPNVQALQAQVQALIQQNAQLLQAQQQQPAQGAGTQAPQQGPGVAQGQPEADPALNYNLAIPDDVAGAIFNEDAGVAKRGLEHLINNFGRIVHQRVTEQVDRIVEQRLQGYQQQQELTTQQQQMQDDYYANFKDHNDPGIRVIVAQEAQAMWAENPSLPWDENSRNTLGTRVNTRLGRVVPQTGQVPAPAPTPVPTPAAQMGASTRPPAPADSDENFISTVLSAG